MFLSTLALDTALPGTDTVLPHQNRYTTDTSTKAYIRSAISHVVWLQDNTMMMMVMMMMMDKDKSDGDGKKNDMMPMIMMMMMMGKDNQQPGGNNMMLPMMMMMMK